MRTRFDQQLEKLHVELIKMGSLCEQAITLAASSLEVQEENTLHKVAALESEVDAKEREIEDICMRQTEKLIQKNVRSRISVCGSCFTSSR